MVTLYYPDPINQFNRLVKVSGSRPTGTYIFGDPWNNIHNGSDYDNRNCTAAIGAVLRDAWTGGRQKSNPVHIRNHQSDWSGGIGWDDVRDAWLDIWGEGFSIPVAYDWYDVLQALREGRYVGIQGDYDQVPYTYQIQKGAAFDHAFGLGGYRPSDGRVLRYDPLDKNADWVPQSAIRGAAEKLALVQRGTKTRLFVAVTRPVPAPPTATPQPITHRVSVQPIGSATYRYFFRYYIGSDGRIKAGDAGRDRRRTEGFSALSTGPQRKYWPGIGEYRTLVQIRDSSSSRNGWWIDAGYAEVR